MKDFEDIYDELLVEMPHLVDLKDHGVSSDSGMFDMELENLSNRKDLSRYFHKLFFRGGKRDRNGDTIFARDDNEKNALLKYLLRQEIVLLFIKKIGRFNDKQEAGKWLVSLVNRKPLHESDAKQLYKISLRRNQDASVVKKFKTSAVSKKQALNNIKHRIRTTYPEYLNSDLYFIRLDDVVEQTVTTTTYDPQQYWWNRD